MLYQIGIPLVVIAITCLVFNPYMAYKPKTEEELWKTNELSYGHPFYWKMRYDKCEKKEDVTNRHSKCRVYTKNIMYIE